MIRCYIDTDIYVNINVHVTTETDKKPDAKATTF